MSSFKGSDLFGSGPHRFKFGKQGELALSPAVLYGGSGAGSTIVGQIELDIIVVGRLVAASESGLWTLRNNITAQCAYPAIAGTLVDNQSKSFANMTLITYVEADRTDRGRLTSVAYVATFRKL